MDGENEGPVSLDLSGSPWEQVYTVSPLVIVGSLEPSGDLDLAPKHMATPLGWGPYFGFVCRPEHATYRNVEERGEFTVTYPLPDDVLLTSLAASPREEDDTKPALATHPTLAPVAVETPLFANGYLFLECRLHEIVDGFGPHGLVTGKVVAARARRDALRLHAVDGQDTLEACPLLVFVSPDRFATLRGSRSFPFPRGFHK